MEFHTHDSAVFFTGIFSLGAEPVNLPILQLGVGDFPNLGLRYLVDEFDISRAAPFDQVFAAVIDELFAHIRPGFGGEFFFQHNKSLDPLDLFLVRDSNHTAISNCLMFVEMAFDLSRLYIHSRRLDHAFFAQLEVKESVPVHGNDISRVQPEKTIGMFFKD